MQLPVAIPADLINNLHAKIPVDKMMVWLGPERFETVKNIGAGIVVLILLSILWNRYRFRRNVWKTRLRLTTNILKPLGKEPNPAQAWNNWLMAMAEVSPAENVYYYQYEPGAEHFKLKAMRAKRQDTGEEGDMNSSSDKPNHYVAPPILPSIDPEKQIRALAGGKRFELFWLKDDDDVMGFLQVGPPMGRWTKEWYKATKKLTESMALVQRVLIERTSVQAMLDEAINQEKAAEMMAASSLGGAQFKKSILSMVMHTLKADAVFALKVVRPAGAPLDDDAVNNGFELVGNEGMTADEAAEIERNAKTIGGDLGRMKVAAQLRKAQSLTQYPFSLLSPSGYQSCISVPLWANKHFWGFIIVLGKDSEALGSSLLPPAIILANMMAMNFAREHVYQDMNRSYVETLIALVDYDDSLETVTRGHSRQMAAYSSEFARALDLGEAYEKSAWMAGYLHDVGMSGFLREISTKQGKLTDTEMEEIRHHAGRGGMLVGSIQDPMPITPYIRHHHERWDGMGYPDGLKGEDIPIGGRILAIVDFFCAMATARSYRSPVPVKKVLEEIEHAAGTQLDPNLAERFVSFWRKKLKNYEQGDPAVMACWNLKQCPDFVHANCPAYGKLNARCWETPGIQCEKHGDECQSCMVFTAHMLAQDLKRSQ